MDVLDRADLPSRIPPLPEFQRLFPDDARILRRHTWRKPAGETALPARTAARRERFFENRPGVLRCRKW